MATPDPNAPPPPPPAEEPRRRSSPLLWILLLVALLLFGWMIYSQRSGTGPAPVTEAPPAIEIGDGQDAAAERERAADEARRREREAREQPPRPPAAPATTIPDREAAPLTRVEPEYPAAAYRRREEGTVLVAVLVSARGQPSELRVARRSGSRELDQAALEAVRQWTFEPAVRDGKPVESEVQVPVGFRISD